MASQNGYEFLKTGSREYIKSYIEYDGSNRMIKVTEARANAKNGEYALVTEYSYVGVTNYIQASKEYGSTWNSAYDF